MKRVLLAVAALAVVLSGAWVWVFERPSGPATPRTIEMAEGVRYERVVLTQPRPNVLHWVTIDLAAGHELFVEDATEDGLATARTGTGRLEATGGDLTIDANFFHYPQSWVTPWQDFPGPGERMGCIGVAYANGMAVCDRLWEGGATLYVASDGEVGFRRPDASRPGEREAERPRPTEATIRHAVSGRRFLVRAGRPLDDDPDPRPYPRAALGLDESGRWMTWLVVDGQVEGERDGLGLREVAEVLRERGVWTGIELDGGGSAEIAGRLDGRSQSLSQPTHAATPGWAREVPIHLVLRLRR